MATELKTLIKWDFVQEAPLTKDRPLVIEEMWKAIPCHSQAVERTIKLVSESCKNVIGEASRNGFIKSTIQSRSITQSFSSKNYFKFS